MSKGKNRNKTAGKAGPRQPDGPQQQLAIEWYNRGLTLQQQGRLDDAAHAYRQAIQINPRFAEAINNLGNVLKDQGDWRAAIDAYRQALRIYPGHAMLLNNLGHALHRGGQSEQAIRSLKQALHVEPGYAEAWVNLGNALKDGDEQGAIAAYRKALQCNPDLPEAYNNLGALLEEQGQAEEARDALQRAVSLRSDFGEAHRHLANLTRFSDVTDHVRAMERLMASRDTRDHDKLHLGFALGKAYEDIGDYAKAMEYLSQANRLARQGFNYDLADDRAYFEALMASFDAHRLAGENSGIEDETPIFIVGMPRSGTSLVEQILASHPRVHGAGELAYLPRALQARCATLAGGDQLLCMQRLNRSGFRQIGNEYLKQLRSHDRAARFVTDKLPHNFLNVGLIRLVLPRARIIHCQRNPLDTCLSIYKNYFTGHHPYAYDQVELGRYYCLYQKLMAHWQAVAGNAVFNLRYEELVEDQEGQTRALLDYCGLEWDAACLSFAQNKRRVSTASSAQVRRPIYRDSVALWKRYEAGLDELIRTLGEGS